MSPRAGGGLHQGGSVLPEESVVVVVVVADVACVVGQGAPVPPHLGQFTELTGARSTVEFLMNIKGVSGKKQALTRIHCRSGPTKLSH